MDNDDQIKSMSTPKLDESWARHCEMIQYLQCELGVDPDHLTPLQNQCNALYAELEKRTE